MNRLTLLSAVSLIGLFTACNTDPKTASRRYIGNGNKYFERGKFKQASIMYRKALQKDPRNGEAWYRLGLASVSEQNVGEARRDFQRSSQLESTPGALKQEALARLADIDLVIHGDLMIHGRVPEAKQFAEELKDTAKTLHDANPNSYDGLRLEGYSSLIEAQQTAPYENGETAEQHEAGRRKRFQEALAYFRAANAVKPYQPEVATMLVQLLFDDKQPAEAEKLAKDLIEKTKTSPQIYDVLYKRYLLGNRPQEAEQLLKKKIAYNPRRADIVAELAIFYYLTQRKPEMLATLSQITSDPKQFPNGRLVAGDVYFSIRDFNGAIQQYQQGLKEDPQHKIIYQKKLVDAFTLSGKNDQAAKVAAELLKDNPKDPEAIATHASVMLQGANPKQADGIIAELQPLLAKTPTTQNSRVALLHYSLARAYALKGDPVSMDQARQHFQDTLAAKPDYIPARLALAQLELGRGDNPKALQLATGVLAVDKSNMVAKLVRAGSLMNMKDYDQARQELTALLKDQPNSNDVRFAMGRLDYTQHFYKEAEAIFDQLAKAKDPRGFGALLQCKVAQGQFDEGIRLIQAELRSAPDNFNYRLALGSLEYTTQKYQDAIKDFQYIIDRNGKSMEVAAVYIRLGEAKRRAGDINGAIASFNKAKELAPKDSLPLLQLALLFEGNGRGDEARKTYDAVLKMQPDNAVALNNIAYSKADEGVDLDTALTFAERARNTRPNDPDVTDTLSLIYLKKNLTEDGLRLTRELVGRAPANATYRLHFAMALYQKGQKQDAKRELQTALQSNPSERDQQRIRELMAKIG